MKSPVKSFFGPTGYDLLLHAIRSFKIDVVLVIDNERLFSDLKSTSFAQPVECIKLRKAFQFVNFVFVFFDFAL